MHKYVSKLACTDAFISINLYEKQNDTSNIQLNINISTLK